MTSGRFFKRNAFSFSCSERNSRQTSENLASNLNVIIEDYYNLSLELRLHLDKGLRVRKGFITIGKV